MKIINNSYGLIFNILLTALVLVLIYACQPPPPEIDPRSFDLHPPTQPTNLKATAFSISQINLSWEASVDPVVDTLGVSTGVKGYYIYRDGKKLRANQGTKFSDTGLETGKSYSYTVEAYDAANNTSKMSTPASAATPTPPKVSSEVVADWFAFAQNQEWNKMESIARKAWIFDGVFCPWLCAKEIAWHYGSKTIISYKIKPISDTGETLHTYQVIVTTPSGNETIQVKVYKEIVSGQESWGVDPII